LVLELEHLKIETRLITERFAKSIHRIFFSSASTRAAPRNKVAGMENDFAGVV